ncbi:DUF2288 domain-containing protein [Pseudomonas sp. LS1212]|nr:DUF2288 domain-containing protein [Pseudomonas sp. LS1212]
MAFPNLSINHLFETGFFCKNTTHQSVELFLVKPMTEQPSTLYAKLLGETAVIDWEGLQPFFARGALLWVEPTLDLIEVAQAVAENRHEDFAVWHAAGSVSKLSDTRAADLNERRPEIWAVVVSPWVLIQVRTKP